MKKYFYYFTPAVTVCLLVGTHSAARGLAVKCIDDPYDKDLGNDIAMKNAYMALGGSKQLSELKNGSAIKTLMATQCPFHLKGEKNPVLTWQEVRMARLKHPTQFSNQSLSFFISGTTTGRFRYRHAQVARDCLRPTDITLSTGNSPYIPEKLRGLYRQLDAAHKEIRRLRGIFK